MLLYDLYFNNNIVLVFQHKQILKPKFLLYGLVTLVFVKPTDQSHTHPYRLEWRNQAFKRDQYFQTIMLLSSIRTLPQIYVAIIFYDPSVANVWR